jgi:hypothetical protein
VRSALTNSKNLYATPLGTVFRNSQDGWALLQESSSIDPGRNVKLVVVHTTNGGITWKVLNPNLAA